MTPKSFVADFIIMTACGYGPEELDAEKLKDAVAFMKTTAEEDPILNFEDVYPTLHKAGYGVEEVFSCPVTEETADAYAAYLCYAA